MNSNHDKVILDVRDLKVYFYLDEGILKAVDGVSFQVKEHRTLGVVGESGCGKSVTSLAIMRIVPDPGRVSGELLLTRKDGTNVDMGQLDRFGPEMRAIRGAEIAMIFQEPMNAFSPVHTIGNQIMEGILLHVTSDQKEAEEIALEMLAKVQMGNPKQALNQYPYQLSGGMRQRAMIAMALACQPAILIADEPTTALDVTVQAQVLELMKTLQEELGMAIIFITHDMGVIADMSDDVAVMYLGRVVEFADVDTIFHNPCHPYTQELLASVPTLEYEPRTRLRTIEGTVPVPLNLGPGCGFYSRCRFAEDRCKTEYPLWIQVEEGHFIRCFRNHGG